MIPLDQRAFVVPGVLCKDLGDEAVLLDLTTETYFGLNAVGSRFLKLLTTTPSIRDALAVMANEYDVAPDELERDARALIDDLVGRGLVRIGSA